MPKPELIPSCRIEHLNKRPIDVNGSYILYWVQASPRSICNHALEYACSRALELGKPVLACFGLTQRNQFNRNANARHYKFMLQGLEDLSKSLSRRRIPFYIGISYPPTIALLLASKCVQLIVDKGYLRIQREWYDKVKAECPVRVTQIETNVVVPVTLASNKEEYAARTIRPKIWNHAKSLIVTPDTVHLPDDLQQLEEIPIFLVEKELINSGIEWIDMSEGVCIDEILDQLQVDKSVKCIDNILGGETAALESLKKFCETKLEKYDEKRNIPGTDYLSHMSMYLHFGQISPITIIESVNKAKAQKASKDSYIEELMIRRELAMNFTWYNENYDSLKCLPDWALKTIEDHSKDKRAYTYTRLEFEKGLTHDKYWNACQLEMVETGKMHGYMRMYWGKKVIEWSADCNTAFHTLIYLNDKYELDGRDPNGYAGIAWCFGKHDQGWAERPVFGKIRYMNEQGLKRKFKDTLEMFVLKNYKLAGRKVGDDKRLRHELNQNEEGQSERGGEEEEGEEEGEEEEEKSQDHSPLARKIGKKA